MPARRLLIPSRPLAVAGALLAAVALMGLVLGGCSTIEKAKSAAIVNGVAISDADVARTTQELNDGLVTDPTQAIPELQVINLLIIGKVLRPWAETSGFWVPNAQYNALLQKIPNASQASQDVIAASIIYNQLQSQGTDAQKAAATEALTRADIQVDPRFGTFDPKGPGTVALTPNWIKPTPSATASATATAP